MTAPITTSRTGIRAGAAVDRWRRGVQLCSCGGEYRPGVDGRQAHRLLFGHTPSPAPAGGVR